MSPFSPRLKLLTVFVATLAIAALVTVSAGAAGMGAKPGQSSIMSTPGTTTMHSGAIMGSGAASSVSNKAWLVKGDPSSKNVASATGVFGFAVRDATDIHSVASTDTLQYGLARIHDPTDDSKYEIRFTGLDKASANAKFGGVGILKPVFGATGVGEPTLPQTVAYIAVFGKANIHKNGQRIASDVPAHMVVIPGIVDPATGKMLSADSINYGTRELLLHVPGPVEGLPDGKLLAFWPSASLDLNDVGGRPMNQQAIAMAVIPGFPAGGAVLGEAVEVVPQHVQFSLRSNDILSYVPADFSTGYTRITVVNNSTMSRGAIIRARDVIGSPIARYTPVLRPGQSYSFFTHLGPGGFNVLDYHSAVSRGTRHWRSSYQTSFDISK